MIKDLYLTLRVSPDASDEEIKKSFRAIAFRSHPDRNQTRPDAEERFKEANYAYSILGNSDKRRRYDLYREFMLSSTRFGLAPNTAQEKLLEDLFLNSSLPGFKQGFPWDLETLSQMHPLFDFSRTSAVFINRVYKVLSKEEEKDKSFFSRLRTASSSVIKEADESFRPFLHRTQVHRKKRKKRFRGRAAHSRGNTTPQWQDGDIECPLELTREEASNGARTTVSYLQDSSRTEVVVNVPPGVREGTRLKVMNKGNLVSGGSVRGDLYLRVSIK